MDGRIVGRGGREGRPTAGGACPHALGTPGKHLPATTHPAHHPSQLSFNHQRYLKHLPSGGEIVVFDRSWYNRAGVERVMGFCDDAQLQEFFRTTPDLENMLIRSGIILVKYWFRRGSAVGGGGGGWGVGEVGLAQRRLHTAAKPCPTPSPPSTACRTTNRSGGSRTASTTRPSGGSSPPWTCTRGRAGWSTPRPRTTCSSTPTPSSRPGGWCPATTKRRPSSTAWPTCCRALTMATCRARPSPCRPGRRGRTGGWGWGDVERLGQTQGPGGAERWHGRSQPATRHPPTRTPSPPPPLSLSQEDTGYVRPPPETQAFVPEVYKPKAPKHAES